MFYNRSTNSASFCAIKEMSANSFVYMLFPCLPIGQLNKPLLTSYNCETVHTKLEEKLVLSGPLCFYNSI